MKTDIILIHTGTKFPEYINHCITQLKKFNFNIHIIISEILIPSLIHNDIIISKEEDYIDSDYNSYQIKNHDTSFRDGFWKRTSSRFILLSSYVHKNNISSFFHIENDNLIFSDLSDTKYILDNSKFEMALVIDSENRCIPSIMYVNSLNIIKLLSDYIIRNNFNNDMLNTFNFFNSNKDKVTNLPILPNSVNIEKCVVNYSNFYTELNSIFDGAAIGQYLYGVDSNENTVGFINETTIFDVSNFEYIWEDNIPFMVVDNNKIKINNLHIHSKKLNILNE
jgi:hypothetical protein